MYLKSTLNEDITWYQACTTESGRLMDCIRISVSSKSDFKEISHSMGISVKGSEVITQTEFNEVFREAFCTIMPLLFPGLAESAWLNCEHQLMTSDDLFCKDCGCVNSNPSMAYVMNGCKQETGDTDQTGDAP